MAANSIQDIVNSPSGSIQKIQKEYGMPSARAVIVLYMSDALSFLNVTRSMTESQISQTVDVLIDCFPDYTPEDYKRFFTGFKNRKYGNLFEGVDGSKIMEAIGIYDEDREIELEQVRKQKKESDKSDLDFAPEFVDLLRQFVKPPIELDIEFVEPPKRERTEHENSVQRYIQEFDKVWLNKHSFDKQLSFKQIRMPSGEMLHLEQYINKRFDDEYGNNQPSIVPDLPTITE